jgi:hypothetical protein
MNELTTRLRLLPVCSCGYVFREGIVIHKIIHETNGIKYATHAIIPSMCPNCKKKIECIEHNRYTVMIKGEENV